ncbi:hypothetical protein C8N46_10995 [Kordia periserrulae]|uniref:Uncharacterized protein n=1 Tax=Kordia periserrulae TaxID=701523 RepID=A0A2T6BU07_9FLAO|nr:hypothetical protein [Kordia periserrulae]PTX59506.1 hypothetical protein C8N46_10995 [Kordia periserrulae]
MQHLLTQIPKKKQQAAANVVHQRAVFQLVDNRSQSFNPSGLFQNTAKNTTVQRQVIQFVKTKYGDSGKLARERFKRGGGKRVKGIDFKKWKRGREAQHLIPAQVCRDYGIPKSWANSAVNGMMLPSGRRNTNHLRIKRLDKGKMHHIKGGGSHPNYNKYAFGLAKQHKWRKGKVTRAQFDKLTNTLRKKNRPKRTGKAKGYIDDLR